MTKLFGEPTLPRLSSLVQQVRQGQLQIPDFQRSFVWTDDQRLELMDSIYQQLPIGSLLIWRTSTHPDMAVRIRLGPFLLPPPAEAEYHNYILDGLQRLTTLYCAFSRPQDGVEDDDGVRWPIYVDFENEDAVRFLVLSSNRKPKETQAPLWILFDDEAFDEFRSKLPPGNNFRRTLRSIETRFRDYILPLIPLYTDRIESVKEAFVRVNSSGTRMGEAAMVRAFTLDNRFDLEKRFEEVREDLGDSPWRALADDDFLAIFKVYTRADLYRGDPRALGRDIKAHPDFLRVLPGLVRRAGAMLEGWGIGGPGALPYIYLFAGICLFLSETTEPEVVASQQQENWRRWFFALAYREALSGASSAQIYRMIDNREVTSDAVEPARKVIASSVRGKLALCSMARAGGPELVRRYGEQGTEAVKSLRSPSVLADRVLATSKERAELKRLLKRGGGVLTHEEVRLLRCHLFLGLDEPQLPAESEEALLERRQTRLEEIERTFVEGIGLQWQVAGLDRPR